MTEEESAVEVAPPQEAEEAAAGEPAAGEAPKLELKPGERVKKPVRPDDSEVKTAIEALQSQSEWGAGGMPRPRAAARRSVPPSPRWRWRGAETTRAPYRTPPAVNKNKARIEAIKELIEGKRSGRSKGSSEQQQVKNKLAELRNEFQKLVVRARGGGREGKLSARLVCLPRAQVSGRSLPPAAVAAESEGVWRGVALRGWQEGAGAGTGRFLTMLA